MPLTLVLNGAEARLQIVCGRGTELLFSEEWFTPRHGMRVLLPALTDALARADLPLSALERIAVVRGPGSFTGLRLVLATALGLARALNIPMGGIGYLDALATDAAGACPPPLSANSPTPLWVLTHARRGIVHLQGFHAGANAAGVRTVVPFCPPDAASLETAAARIAASAPQSTSPCPILAGSGVIKNHEFFHESLSQAWLLPERFLHVAPETLLRLSSLTEYGVAPVDPLYIRPCDAEENLDSIVVRQGMDPATARAALARFTSRSH